jgi:tetratricopeptide (TPR) repeat protein
MKLSRKLWLQVEPLLTTALEMNAAERAAWLEALGASNPEVAPLLRRMLDTHERAERAGDMETVPRLAPSPPASSPHSPADRIGPFRLLRQVGRGGMGEVWLAEQADGRVERQVALKLPALHLQGGVWDERFRRERDILARLTHPNIARLYDAGVAENGQPYLAMEYVEGESLTDYVTSHALALPARLQLFRQVLAATGHAHRHLVVHRDLKPANILIDQSGQVKLLDFGIAKLLDDEEATADAQDLTRAGGRVMTKRYAAPEQVSGEAITTATDIYTLGVVLEELAGATREGNRDVDAIINKARRPEPADRYASIEQFDDDIVRHLERRPVKARAGTWRYLAGRFVVRNKLPLAMAAAVFVTLAAGLVMVEQQRRVAVAEKARAQKHFASVRKLANVFIFEVHGEIEALPGSLKAREMLIKTSLEYLDALVGEAGNDPSLMYELAAAYRNIGNIQGQPGAANTGDLSSSLANFEKSKRLFVALEPLRPDDIDVVRDQMRLSYAMARAYFVRADPRWQAEIAGTIKLAQRVTALPGAGPRDRARVASALAEQAHLSSLQFGQSPAVEADIVKAIEILEGLLREMPGQLGVRENLASTYQRAADIFAGSNRTDKSVRQAIEYRRKALALLRGVAAEYPEDQRVLKIEQENVFGLATELSLAGEHREANQVIGEALKRVTELQAADPKNVELIADRMKVLNQASIIAYRLGDLPRSARYGRDALALSAKFPEEVLKSRDMRSNIAEVKSSLGAALLATALSPSTDRGRKSALLLEARSMLGEAAAFLGQAKAENLGSINAAEERELRGNLERCDEAIAKLAG